MKKRIALVLALAMIFSGLAGVYAASPSLPSDVGDTVYEVAVAELAERGIIKGYPDGAFKPGNSVTRAEIAKMVALTVAKNNSISSSELASAASSALAGFNDLGTDSAWRNWAVDYIGYAVEKGILDGYPDKTFKAQNKVTYYEVAKMLVKGLGIKEESLEGEWPSNYMNKALELGIMKGLVYKGENAATRGNVARMIYNGFYADKPVEPSKPIDLTQYTVAYGMVNGVSTTLNKDDLAVKAVELRIGENTVTVPAYNAQGNTAIENLDENDYTEGALYAFRLQRKMGEIIEIAEAGSAASWVKKFIEITPSGSIPAGEKFAIVSSVSDNVILFKDEDGDYTGIGIAGKCVVYKLDKVGDKAVYEAAKLSTVKKGSKVRLYDVTNDKNDDVDIIVVDVR